MAISKFALKITLFLCLCVVSMTSQAQELSIDRFCEIYADSAPQRVDKIIRIFNLEYRPAAQLTGNAKCPAGEVFSLKTACIGNYRVAILSLAHPGSQTYPAGASKLFHLYTVQAGDDFLTPCQPATTQ